MCNAMADCTNTNGSYICTCPDGYRGSGVNNCTNIDECQENLDDCDMRASCVDTDGSYNCTCGDGYTGNGTTCESKLCHFTIRLGIISLLYGNPHQQV